MILGQRMLEPPTIAFFTVRDSRAKVYTPMREKSTYLAIPDSDQAMAGLLIYSCPERSQRLRPMAHKIIAVFSLNIHSQLLDRPGSHE